MIDTCYGCGKPAEGFAMINDFRFCHGDDGVQTCYEVAQFQDATYKSVAGISLFLNDPQEEA